MEKICIKYCTRPTGMSALNYLDMNQGLMVPITSMALNPYPILTNWRLPNIQQTQSSGSEYSFYRHSLNSCFLMEPQLWVIIDREQPKPL